MTNAEAIFEDLIYYEQVKLKSNRYKEIKDEYSLQRWLVSTVEAKGARNGKLSNEISRTKKFKEIIDLQEKVYHERMETGYEVYSKDKTYAKCHNLIYEGKNKFGRKYFYSYGKKGFVKNPAKKLNKI